MLNFFNNKYWSYWRGIRVWKIKKNSKQERIKAVKEAYDKHPNKIVSTKVITIFLSLILTLNNFKFNLVNYVQKMGCTMGTVWAPSYADLFMAQFEEKHI